MTYDYAASMAEFQTSTQLKNYVCSDNFTDMSSSDLYLPVCPFPYMPEGWLIGDVTSLDDCSQTYAVSAPGYETKCMFFVLASIPGTAWMAYQLHYKNALLSKDKLFGNGRLGGGLTESEKIVWIGMLFGFSNMFLGSDINCWADRIDWRTTRTIFMGASVACLNHAVVILIRLWGIIADGGASKICPPWMIWLSRIMYIGCYVVEIGFSYLEVNSGKDPDTVGGISGNMGNVKYLWTVIFSVVQSFICIKYYRKIAAQLGDLTEDKKKVLNRTKRLCGLTSFFLIFFGLARFAGMAPRWGKTYQMLPPCEDMPIMDGLWFSRTLTTLFYPLMNRPKAKDKGGSGEGVANFKSTTVESEIASRASSSVAPEG